MISNRIEVVPISNALGAEIRGVDLSKPLSDADFATVHRAFLDHQVIFIRGQNIAPQQQLDFAARFGPPRDYPFLKGLPECPLVMPVIKEPHETLCFGSHWHFDTAYLEEPPLATCLYCKELPARGGDTLFASMYLAYDALSAGMKALLDGLTAVNSASLLAWEQDQYASNKSKDQGKRNDAEAEHPVVRVHPETGRKALYVNTAHTSHFRAMTREESLPVLNYLFTHLTRPEFNFRLGWEEGMVTVWDNRCTQHSAVNDYHGQRRIMHRVTVGGGRPFGPRSAMAGRSTRPQPEAAFTGARA